MRATTGTGSYYFYEALPKSPWRYRLKGVEIDGVIQKPVQAYGRTRTIAKQKVEKRITEIKAEAERQKKIKVGVRIDQTVEEYLDQWWPTAMKNNGQPLTPRSSESLRASIQHHINPVIGDIKLSELTTQHVEDMVKVIAKKGKSATTVRNAYFCLSKALKQAKKSGFITANPMNDIDKAPSMGRHKEAAVMTAEELQLLLSPQDADGEVRWSVIFRLVASTGMRSGEVLGLQWKNLDLETGRVQIRQTSMQSPNYGNIIGETKTPESRRTITVKAMIPDLKAHLDYVTIMDEKANRLEKEVSSDWVFTGVDGQVMAPNSLYEALKRRIKLVLDSIDAADIKAKKRWEYLYDEFTVKSLRTTAATLMHLNGVGDKEIQEILGHTSIATTMKHYVKTNDTKKNEAVDVLSKAIGLGEV